MRGKALGDPVLRIQFKSQIDLLKMGIAGENIRDAKILHDDHAGEIDEGDVRLIVVAQPKIVGPTKSIGRDYLEPMASGVD